MVALVGGAPPAANKPPIPEAQSQQPAPQTSQTQPAQKERGTEEAPFIIKVIPAEKSEDDLAREDEKAHDRISADRLVKITSDLALYTQKLFYATVALAL